MKKIFSLSGVQLAFLTAVISGISVFINKFAVGMIKPPVLFTGVKNAVVGVLLFAVLLGLKKSSLLKKLSIKQWGKLAVIGVVGGYVPFYLFFTGLAGTSAVNAAIIQKTLVFWVALLAWPLLKEKLSLPKLIGVMLLFYANAVIGGFFGFTFSSGEWMILAATIFWAVENVFAKQVLKDLDPDVVTFGRMGIGSALLLVTAHFSAPMGLSTLLHLSTTQWFWLLATAATLLLYVMTWYRALKVEKATTVTAILVSATLITNILNAIFVTHSWNLVATYQLLLMVAGLALFLAGAKLESRKTVRVQQLEVGE